MSERYLTFTIDEELPHLSLVQLEHPFSGYLTIIPTEGELPSSPKGSHYRALILGVSEENMTKVRKIVNQLIYNARITSEQAAVEKKLHQDYVEKAQAPVLQMPLRRFDEQGERLGLKRSMRGKSKL